MLVLKDLFLYYATYVHFLIPSASNSKSNDLASGSTQSNDRVSDKIQAGCRNFACLPAQNFYRLTKSCHTRGAYHQQCGNRILRKVSPGISSLWATFDQILSTHLESDFKKLLYKHYGGFTDKPGTHSRICVAEKCVRMEAEKIS